ncbi:MAG: DUF2442 domain-containing protein [Bacteroidota bacterium]|nr:DUF2442 domain-containing protein [Bacteroidota bacterium]
MSTLAVKTAASFIKNVWFDDLMLHARFLDGREVSVPLDWFPKLRDANNEQRNNWRLIGEGIGVHWEEIDEDISVESLTNF